MIKRVLALGLLIVAGTVGKTEAAIITFEDIAQAHGTETVFSDIDAISGGFLFDAQSHSHVANAVWNTDNGSTYMVLDDVLGPDLLTVSQVGGGAFSLSSIDLSRAHGIVSATAAQVVITGNQVGGGTVTRILNLTDSLSTPGNYFSTFALDAADFGNLTSFTLLGQPATPRGGNYYAIDNLAVGTPVPEPGTLSLLGLGSAYLFRRRKTAGR